MVDTQEAARTVSALAIRLLDAYCHTGDAAADAAVADAVERTAEHLIAWSDAINGTDRPVRMPRPSPSVETAGLDTRLLRRRYSTSTSDYSTGAESSGSADPASLRHTAMVFTQVSAAVQRTVLELAGPLQTRGHRIATALDQLAALVTREAELLAQADLLDRLGDDELEMQRAHRAVGRAVATLQRTASAILPAATLPT